MGRTGVAGTAEDDAQHDQQSGGESGRKHGDHQDRQVLVNQHDDDSRGEPDA
jgi:hypothetical protein